MHNLSIIWLLDKKDLHVFVLGQPLSDIGILINGVGLLFTLFFSLKAIKESARANSLSSLPIMTLQYFDSLQAKKEELHVENIGTGTALNIRMNSFYQSYIDDVFHSKKALHYVLKVTPIDILKPGERKAFDTSESKVGPLINVELMLFKVFNSNKTLSFYVRYQDISGAEFISTIKINSKGVQIAGTPKRFTILRKCRYYTYLLSERSYIQFARILANVHQRNSNLDKGNKN